VIWSGHHILQSSWKRVYYQRKKRNCLKPKIGHYDGHGFWRVEIKSGKFIWAPPPGAADIAVEELRKALIKEETALMCSYVLVYLHLTGGGT
jgi:hypothetical protein